MFSQTLKTMIANFFKPSPVKEKFKATHVIDIKGKYFATDGDESFVSEIKPRDKTPLFNPFPKV